MRLLLATLVLLLSPALAVKREDFKECAQTSFCRRLRALSAKHDAAVAMAPGSFVSPYSLGAPSPASAVKGEAAWTFPLSSSLYPDINFELRVDILDAGNGGVARVRVDEVGSVSPWRRYNETARWVLVDAEPKLGKAKLATKNGVSTVSYGDGLALQITHSPLKITQSRNGVEQVVFNDRALFHMEHYRTKEIEEVVEEVKTEEAEPVEGDADVKVEVEVEAKAEPESPPEQKPFEPKIDRSWFETEDNDMFEEQWKRWRDTKPKGASLPIGKR